MTKELIPKEIESEEREEFDYSKKTIVDLIEKGADLLEDAIDTAKETHAPRAVEVATNLIKTLGELSSSLSHLRSAYNNIKAKKADRGEPIKEFNEGQFSDGMVSGNTTIFVGNSLDAIKGIMEINNSKQKEEENAIRKS